MTEMYKPDFDEKKFSELLLYIAERGLDDPGFGATKLNKILYFSDFLAYKRRGKPITGATYQKLRHGPAPRELLPVVQKMQKRDDAFLRTVERFGLAQKRLMPLREPNLAAFDAAEVAIVDEVVDALSAYNAIQTSLISHALSEGWRLAHEGEPIPYQAAFLKKTKLTDQEVEEGLKLARERGWLVAASG
jgi:uncharacterized phage-associated protein